jgi:hypothetical protein
VGLFRLSHILNLVPKFSPPEGTDTLEIYSSTGTGGMSPRLSPPLPLRQKEGQRYSLRRATMGSTFMALRAGIRAAIMATVLSSAPAKKRAAGLFP